LSTLIKRVRLFIKNKEHAKLEGGANIYFVALLLIMLILIIFKFMLDKERIYVTYDAVDDALVSSMISGCIYNKEERSLSDQVVIYRTITDVTITPQNGPVISPVVQSPLDDPDIFDAQGDLYLEQSYNAFLDNLKHNLKLDDSMVSSISGINGPVEIEEFSLYNVFKDYDNFGNLLGTRIVQYTRLSSGVWVVTPYMVDAPVYVDNSFDDQPCEITATSMVVRLGVNVVLSNYMDWLMEGFSPDDMTQRISYQRIVDVTE